MTPNLLTIDFLAQCVANKTFDEQQAKTLLCKLGVAIDSAIVKGDDAAELQHAHDVILDLISIM